MELVKFISSINVEEVPMMGRDSIEIRSWPMDRISPVLYGNDCLITQTVERHIVPIKTYFMMHSKSIGDFFEQSEYSVEKDYIAVSPLLDDTLGKYIKCLNGEFAELKDKVYRANVELQTEKSSTIYWKDLYHGNIEWLSKVTIWQRIKWIFTGVKI